MIDCQNQNFDLQKRNELEQIENEFAKYSQIELKNFEEAKVIEAQIPHSPKDKIKNEIYKIVQNVNTLLRNEPNLFFKEI